MRQSYDTPVMEKMVLDAGAKKGRFSPIGIKAILRLSVCYACKNDRLRRGFSCAQCQRKFFFLTLQKRYSPLVLFFGSLPQLLFQFERA